ncbi:MAG: hypothetical protein IPL31_00380 [Saprospiraceae bacterium]|nr:hypothetical protein [Saprospiraceae bacterium]
MLDFKPNHFLLFGWLVVLSIIVLSLLPGKSMQTLSWLDFLALDKIGHLLFYGAASWCFRKYQLLKFKTVQYISIGFWLLFLGISLEGLQYLSLQGRQFDVLDIIANGFGILFGFFILDPFLGSGLRKLIDKI